MADRIDEPILWEMTDDYGGHAVMVLNGREVEFSRTDEDSSGPVTISVYRSEDSTFRLVHHFFFDDVEYFDAARNRTMTMSGAGSVELIHDNRTYRFITFANVNC